MPTSSQALILIKTDSGRLSTFYKTRITPEITPFPLSKVNLTGETNSGAALPARSGVMVSSHRDTFKPGKPLEGLTVNGYRGVLSFDPVLKSFRWQLLPDPTEHTLNRLRIHQRSASAPEFDDADHVHEKVVLTHLDQDDPPPPDQTSGHTVNNNYRRLLDLGFKTSSFRGLDAPPSPEPWDSRTSGHDIRKPTTLRPGSSRPKPPQHAFTVDRHMSAPSVGMSTRQTRTETGDIAHCSRDGSRDADGHTWLDDRRKTVTEPRPSNFDVKSILSDTQNNESDEIPCSYISKPGPPESEVETTTPHLSIVDDKATQCDIPRQQDVNSMSVSDVLCPSLTEPRPYLSDVETKTRPYQSGTGLAGQMRASPMETEKANDEYFSDKPILLPPRAWELSLRGGDLPHSGLHRGQTDKRTTGQKVVIPSVASRYRLSWKQGFSSVPHHKLSSASLRYHAAIPLPPIPESERHFSRSRSRRSRLERSERSLESGLSHSQQQALYEEAKRVNKRKKTKLPAIRMRRELPPPSPHALCFCLKNKRTYTHDEIKAIIEDQIHTSIGTLLFDPVYLHLGVEDTEGACLWVFTLADDALRILLIHQGLHFEGERLRVRRYDDVLYDEHEAYRLYRDITEEQRRRQLTSKRRSSLQKPVGGALRLEKHVAFSNTM